jgi:hypothetical protein
MIVCPGHPGSSMIPRGGGTGEGERLPYQIEEEGDHAEAAALAGLHQGRDGERALLQPMKELCVRLDELPHDVHLGPGNNKEQSEVKGDEEDAAARRAITRLLW